MFLSQRNEFFKECINSFGKLLPKIDMPELKEEAQFLDFTVDNSNSEWITWKSIVKREKISNEDVQNASKVIETVDTI